MAKKLWDNARVIPTARLGLCLQVWFQNKRSKERRLKQLTSMGRGPFFGNSRKMRGFPMNLSPGGLDEAPPGFPYFTTADGKFEFGYGAPAGFHHEFFPGHHPHQGPPGQPLPFSNPGEKFYILLYYNKMEIDPIFSLPTLASRCSVNFSGQASPCPSLSYFLAPQLPTRVRQRQRTEILRPSGHHITAAILGDTIKETLCCLPYPVSAG